MRRIQLLKYQTSYLRWKNQYQAWRLKLFLRNDVTLELKNTYAAAAAANVIITETPCSPDKPEEDFTSSKPTLIYFTVHPLSLLSNHCPISFAFGTGKFSIQPKSDDFLNSKPQSFKWHSASKLSFLTFKK